MVYREEKPGKYPTTESFLIALFSARHQVEKERISLNYIEQSPIKNRKGVTVTGTITISGEGGYVRHMTVYLNKSSDRKWGMVIHPGEEETAI